MKSVSIKYNGSTYEATYNKSSGYYEATIRAPDVGGMTFTDITYTNEFGTIEKTQKEILVFLRQPEKIEIDKAFMWILDGVNLSIKDVVEIMDDYEINIDDETNVTSSANVLKNTNAKADDLVLIKKNGRAVYWGIIDNIEFDNGIYRYTLKYIINLFDTNVPLRKNSTVEESSFDNGVYLIKSALDTSKVLDVCLNENSDGTNIIIWTEHNVDNQRFRITKIFDEDLFNSWFIIEPLSSPDNKKVAFSGDSAVDRTNIHLWHTEPTNKNQRWGLRKCEDSDAYKIFSKQNENYVLDVNDNSPKEGTNVILFTNKTKTDINQKWYLERQYKYDIESEGLESFLAEEMVNANIPFSISMLPLALTATKLKTSVVDDNSNLFNLKTFMNNCTQMYGIRYKFYIEHWGGHFQGTHLLIDIENKELDRILLDVKAHPIFNYNEVFETNIVASVKVLTKTDEYNLYLKTDRTTTTNEGDANRARGRSETIYVDDYKEARQKALDTIQGNRYNHNISFDMIGDLIPVGTPISIKTKDGSVVDTYISAVKITKSRAISYTCGSIRVGFLDKLMKENN